MIKTDLLDQRGEKVGSIELEPQVFAAKVNDSLMAQAVRVRLANMRVGTHKTKSRGEVRGGGRKPWRQKGTGRARHGSIRSPIWVGGGHVKQKQPKDYSLKLSKKMKRLALFSALTSRFQSQDILVLEELSLSEIKTKAIAAVLSNLVDQETVLLVTPSSSKVINRSIRNIPWASAREARNLSAYDILKFDKVIFLKESMDILKETFLDQSIQSESERERAANKKETN